MVNKSKNMLKEKTEKNVNRKARLIVRNLSFKSTESNLREFFGKYGEIEEIQLLKKPDGKLKGCAFIQYQAVQMAAKALFNTNGKPFLEREIVTDWAVPKNKYVQQTVEVSPIKEEILSDNENDEVKSISDEIDLKIEPEVKTEDENEDDQEDNNDDPNEQADNSDEIESEVDDDEDETKSELKPDEDAPRPKVFSNDVTEGKTVFVKNIPFTATNEDLKQRMLEFGRVYYALICKDRFTEHSKGTGFVKFVEKEAAEQCLQSGTELTLLGNILDVYPALDKKAVSQKLQTKENKNRDSRNLYLIKEGVILAGSPAAKGVSKTDMEKRLKLEQWKTQILKNLHMFVSQNRLVIHNVPESWDDAKLKMLFLKHGGSKCEVIESRIMRDLRNVDGNGIGKSKGYGFVTYTTHENAISALRSLNNNPGVFTPASRPIVAFSIENRQMVNAKQQRLEKSKQKNPLCKQFGTNNKNNDGGGKRKFPFKEDGGKNGNDSKKQFGVKRKYPFKEDGDKNTNDNQKQFDVKRKYPFKDDRGKNTNDSKKQFTGVTAKPGISKFRSKFKLRTQAKMHHENLKKDKHLKRKKLQLLNQKQPIKQPKQKMKKRKESMDDFSKLVNKYKATLTAGGTVKKSKWYE